MDSIFVSFPTELLVTVVGVLLCGAFLFLRSMYASKARGGKLPEDEEADISVSVERIPSKEEKDLAKDRERETVVGIAQPVGFWTKKVIGEKLQYLVAAMHSEEPTKSYWRSYVTKRRDQERGRGGKGPGG